MKYPAITTLILGLYVTFLFLKENVLTKSIKICFLFFLGIIIFRDLCIYKENSLIKATLYIYLPNIGIILPFFSLFVYFICVLCTLQVIQRRYDGSVDFYRNWNDYKLGFGSMYSEFWLGVLQSCMTRYSIHVLSNCLFIHMKV